MPQCSKSYTNTLQYLPSGLGAVSIVMSSDKKLLSKYSLYTARAAYSHK